MITGRDQSNKKGDLIVKESEHEPCCELDFIPISQGPDLILGKTVIPVQGKHQPSHCTCSDRGT